MRLLRVDTLALQNFTNESKLPQYAILSHTWLRPEEGEEVLFPDIDDLPAARVKKGWRKVEFATQRARADGLDFVWIDTCCIDKSSSAELSESINSMYRWYQNSEQCYVFLDDMVEKELKDCRWFTRGWTLQEMIAPLRVAFHDAAGHHIGTLDDLAESIATITGVHADLLKGQRHLASFSISQKMHWASKRITTRVEDRAYSMLGIFDINLAVIYGEGARAFQRLQEELLRVYSDHTIFAWGYHHRSRGSAASSHRHGPESRLNEFRTSLLAESPNDFKASSCGSLISIRRHRSQREYEVMGLRINVDLPVFDAPESRDLSAHLIWTALLNCCLEDQPTTSIVIRLLRDPFGNFLRLSLDHCDIYDAAIRCRDCSLAILRYPDDAQHDSNEQMTMHDCSERFMLRCRDTDGRRGGLSIQTVEAHVKMNPRRSHLDNAEFSLPSDDLWESKTGTFGVECYYGDHDLYYEKYGSPVILEARVSLSIKSEPGDIAVTLNIYPEIFDSGMDPGLIECVFNFNSETKISFDRSPWTMRSFFTSLIPSHSIYLLEDWRLLTASVVGRPLLQDRFYLIEFEVRNRTYLPYLLMRDLLDAIILLPSLIPRYIAYRSHLRSARRPT